VRPSTSPAGSGATIFSGRGRAAGAPARSSRAGRLGQVVWGRSSRRVPRGDRPRAGAQTPRPGGRASQAGA
jgi:hypothetical protein